MGIDIYLGGYEAYQARSVEEHAAFDAAVKIRDQFERGSEEAEEAQKAVNVTANALWSGRLGYLRSSYNSGGLFNVLEEIFGFDVGGWLFPGKWEDDLPCDGTEFLRKVQILQEVTLDALRSGTHELPWIEQFTRISGELAPYPHESRTAGELFGASVRGMLTLAIPEGELDPSRPAQSRLSQDHQWYLTHGLKELWEFGECAERIGPDATVYISY